MIVSMFAAILACLLFMSYDVNALKVHDSFLPAGIYGLSCDLCECEDNGDLSCQCETNPGLGDESLKQSATLQNAWACDGCIQNQNGFLRCVLPLSPAQSDGYQQHCQGCSIGFGGALICKICDSDDNYPQLKDACFCEGQVIWNGEALECTPITDAPTLPTPKPTLEPTFPTPNPTLEPTLPTPKPSQYPTFPTPNPTLEPTFPTPKPSQYPTFPTPNPTLEPTFPTEEPTAEPTFPTEEPTAEPTFPTEEPTAEPTFPTEEPTAEPTFPTEEPTPVPTPQIVTLRPTQFPTPARAPTVCTDYWQTILVNGGERAPWRECSQFTANQGCQYQNFCCWQPMAGATDPNMQGTCAPPPNVGVDCPTLGEENCAKHYQWCVWNPTYNSGIGLCQRLCPGNPKQLCLKT